jgi:hypothetical protein
MQFFLKQLRAHFPETKRVSSTSFVNLYMDKIALSHEPLLAVTTKPGYWIPETMGTSLVPLQKLSIFLSALCVLCLPSERSEQGGEIFNAASAVQDLVIHPVSPGMLHFQ